MRILVCNYSWNGGALGGSSFLKTPALPEVAGNRESVLK
jgi:hypothetical protein